MQSKERPRRSITELEKSEWSWQFGLGRLLVVANLLGLVLAIVISMSVYTWGIVAGIAILVGFLSPILVFVYIFIRSASDKVFARSKTETNRIAE